MKLCSPSTVSTIPAVVSNEIALDALCEAAARTTGPLSAALYEKRHAPMHPSVAAVQSCCGFWIDALHDAGLGAHVYSSSA